MTTIAGFPAVKVEFDREGAFVKPTIASDIHTMIEAEQITDLLIVSYGWNNAMDEAQALYDELLGNVAALKSNINETRHRKFGVLAIFWPSKRFADTIRFQAAPRVSARPTSSSS